VITSGAIQGTEPLRDLANSYDSFSVEIEFILTINYFAQPKSDNFTTPSLDTKIFAPFISL
jgi:hypothetical protein